jgi:hypothetical protein
MFSEREMIVCSVADKGLKNEIILDRLIEKVN